MNQSLKEEIRVAFETGTLYTKSVSPNGEIAWKRVCHVQRSEVPWETIYEGHLEGGGSFTLTGGHRVFVTPNSKIEMEQLSDGSVVQGVGEALTPRTIKSVHKVENRRFMYDLTAEDWHNFVLVKSGVLVSNSPDQFYHFRPPEHEARIGNYNRIFGRVWEDYELELYLRMGLDWWNMEAPRTFIQGLDQLVSQQAAWRTPVFWSAVHWAMFALSVNWVQEEFSVRGDTLIDVMVDGEVSSISIQELYEICS